MPSPLQLDLYADRRMVYREYFVFLGEDFTGATYSMKVRPVADTSASALIALGTVTDNTDGIRLLYGGTDTITNHVAAGRLAGVPVAINPATGVNYTAADSTALSQLRVMIGATTMSPPSIGLIPLPQETGDDLTLAYDLLVTLSGDIAIKRLTGNFIVRPTVSLP